MVAVLVIPVILIAMIGCLLVLVVCRSASWMLKRRQRSLPVLWTRWTPYRRWDAERELWLWQQQFDTLAGKDLPGRGSTRE